MAMILFFAVWTYGQAHGIEYTGFQIFFFLFYAAIADLLMFSVASNFKK